MKYDFGSMINFSKERFFWGRGGGYVAVFLKKEVYFLVDTYSPNHIDVIVNKRKGR